MSKNYFEKALFDLIQNYKKALNLMKENEYIKNPVAWALYQTWRKYDNLEQLKEQKSLKEMLEDIEKWKKEQTE